MSLTSFIEGNKEVRLYLRREIPKPKFSIQKDILAPPLSIRYSLTGTAFDYLLRFYIEYLNPNVSICEHWIAEHSIGLLRKDSVKQKKASDIVSNAKKNLDDFLQTGQMSDALIRSTLLLAGLDPIFRAGVGHEYIGIIYEEDVKDMWNLFSIINPETFKSKTLCLLNPTFGFASGIVGGADADLLIDNTLIDIKTTKNFELKEGYFQQLIGYYILHEISEISDIKPKVKI
jgi:hypothetical protein